MFLDESSKTSSTSHTSLIIIHDDASEDGIRCAAAE